MENPTNKPFRWPTLKPLLLGVLAGSLACFFPPAIVFVPAYWASVAFRQKLRSLLLFMAAFLSGALVLYTPFGAVMLTLLCGIPALLLYYLTMKRTEHFTVMAAVSGASILILYALTCLPGILSGEGAFSVIQAFIDAVVENSRGMMDTIAGATPELIGAYDAYLDALSDAAAVVTVPVLCFCSIVIGLCNDLFLWLFVRKKGYDLLPMPAFRTWAIPANFTLGICLFLIGSFALELLQLDYAQALSSTVTVLVGVPLMIQGLALVDFLIVRKGKRIRGRRVLFYTLIGAFIGLLETPLMLTGCLDQVLHIRDRYNAVPPAGPANP